MQLKVKIAMENQDWFYVLGHMIKIKDSTCVSFITRSADLCRVVFFYSNYKEVYIFNYFLDV